MLEDELDDLSELGNVPVCRVDRQRARSVLGRGAAGPIDLGRKRHVVRRDET